MEDKSIVFQAINLMDRYYDSLTTSMPAKDLQLTAVTSLWIASKNLEVEPLCLKTCCQVLCFNKYSKTQFLQKEFDIRKSTNYVNEAPSILDFLIFYMRCIKRQVQLVIDYNQDIEVFIQDIQTIAYDLSKSVIVDSGLLKYKPSVLASSLVFLGFQL